MSKDIITKSLVEKCLDVNGPFNFSHLEYASPIRFNIDKLQYVPEVGHIIISELSLLLEDLTSVGGVASGGDPWAMGLSTLHNIPWFSVKKDGNILGTIYGERVGVIE
ncbi:hypothetical protein HYV89_05660 [Candidatus Woesearchaeota archaeon]|nr:hypothetical protein [Candidatus Woesearchaeota archaeon]